jgi:anti-sigma regulatory factor (Ser/Thr protein kinase)
MPHHEIPLAPDPAAVPRMIDWVGERCAEAGVAPDLAFKITLALEEAVTNVVNHAFIGVAPPHAIRLRLDIGAETVAAEIIDNGREFDPSAQPRPDLSLPLDKRAAGGLGIPLMRAMMDRIEYRRRDGRNHLRLEKRRR